MTKTSPILKVHLAIFFFALFAFSCLSAHSVSPQIKNASEHLTSISHPFDPIKQVCEGRVSEHVPIIFYKKNKSSPLKISFSVGSTELFKEEIPCISQDSNLFQCSYYYLRLNILSSQAHPPTA